MRKLFMCLVLCVLSVAVFAQKEVNVKAGTLVPLQVVNPTKAADVQKGQKVAFREMIPLTNGDVYVTGKNRTALSVVLFALVVWPACFICGSKAEIPAGYEVQANVASNTMVKVD